MQTQSGALLSFFTNFQQNADYRSIRLHMGELEVSSMLAIFANHFYLEIVKTEIS